MVILLAAVVATASFAILFRLLWTSRTPARYSALVTVAAAALVIALALLAASGRLPWLAAVAAAAAPFLRRGVGLLRYLPMLGPLWRASRQGRTRQTSGAAMTRAEALKVLGLEGRPGREQVIAAHRRLVQRLHPDKGGSDYFMQQLNDARQRLLDDV